MLNSEKSRVVLCLYVVFFFIFALPFVSFAQDTYWQADPAIPGNWFDSLNWSVGIPNSSTSVYIDNAGAAQISGNATASKLTIGTNIGDQGTVSLLSGSLLLSNNIYVGRYGTGLFDHIDGILTADYVYIANNLVDAKGDYYLHDGQLNASWIHMGEKGGKAGFLQTGGKVDAEGIKINHLSRYQIDAGEITSTFIQLSNRWGGAGVGFQQNGGIVKVDYLQLACDSSSQSTYNLAGGELHTEHETLYGTAIMRQSAGQHVVDHLETLQSSQFLFTGGNLRIKDTLDHKGTLDFEGQTVVIETDAGAWLDFSEGAIVNASSASIQGGADSLMIFAPGTDPGSVFGNFQTEGIVHFIGEDLIVPAGKTLIGRENITITDHIRCEGTIMEKNMGSLKIDKGIEVLPGANVTSREIRIINDRSGISGGSIQTEYLNVGLYAEDSLFHQTGGSLDASYNVNVSQNSMYRIDDGLLSASGIYVAGNFLQTGGDVTVSGSLGILNSSGPIATYKQQGGTLSFDELYVSGYGKQGRFEITSDDALAEGNYLAVGQREGVMSSVLHTAGEVRINEAVYLGEYSDCAGKYELGGTGKLIAKSMHLGGRSTAEFQQTGGTCNTDFAYITKYGSYQISEGLFSAREMYLPGGSIFQSGGTVRIGKLHTSSNGFTYTISGGELVVDRSLSMSPEATMDFSDVNVLFNAPSGIIDFRKNQPMNTGQASFMLGENSLLLLPEGYDPASAFKTYENQGLVAVADQDIVIPYGRTILGGGYIGGNIVCGGKIDASDCELWFTGGLHLTHDEAMIDLGSGGYQITAQNLGMDRGTIRTTQGYLYSEASSFNHSGGSFYVKERFAQQGNTTYNLSSTAYLEVNGELVVGCTQGMEDFFIQNGGSCVADTLYIGGAPNYGSGSGGSGTYELKAGELRVRQSLTMSPVGQSYFPVDQSYFLQTGGKNIVEGVLSLRNNAEYEIVDGKMNIQILELNGGTLNVSDSDAEVVVYDTLFARSGQVLCQPGSVIKMEGADFVNDLSWNPTPYPWYPWYPPYALPTSLHLESLNLVFSSTEISHVEVSGEDLGAVLSGFVDNNALGSLIIGAEEPGFVQLVDVYDNVFGTDSEALYIENLILGAGSSLDLNGLNLYYQNFVDLGGTIVMNGGSLIQVPEPATLGLLAVGGLALLRRKSK